MIITTLAADIQPGDRLVDEVFATLGIEGWVVLWVGEYPARPDGIERVYLALTDGHDPYAMGARADMELKVDRAVDVH